EGDRGKKLVEYISRLTERLSDDRTQILEELEGLVEKVGHIRGIISAQQNFARRIYFGENVDLAELVENILEMHRVAIGRHGVELEIDLQELPAVYIEKNKLVQVLDNLIKHAIESMAEHRGRRCL